MEVESPFQAAQTIDPEVRAYVYSLVNAVSDLGQLIAYVLILLIAGRSWLRQIWSLCPRRRRACMFTGSKKMVEALR